MKATGIVRKLDTLGRIVLPMELRRTFELEVGDPVEIFVEGSDIVLRKYQPACIFCNDATDIVSVRGKNICRKCLDDIKTL
jgi:AbrB family transcriptional regulator, transcriptional pleiotropic regulator of transition state genes